VWCRLQMETNVWEGESLASFLAHLLHPARSGIMVCIHGGRSRELRLVLAWALEQGGYEVAVARDGSFVDRLALRQGASRWDFVDPGAYLARSVSKLAQGLGDATSVRDILTVSDVAGWAAADCDVVYRSLARLTPMQREAMRDGLLVVERARDGDSG
jgi:hypothetical protein